MSSNNYEPDPSLIAEVLAFEHECIKTFNIAAGEAYDAEKGASYYAKGKRFRMFDFMTPREWDGDHVYEHFKDVMQHYSGKVEMLDIQVHATPSLALVSMIQHLTGKDGRTGKPYEVTFRVTDGLAKSDGKWQWVHQHLSFPVDWASGKPDFQSKPAESFVRVSTVADGG